MTQTVLLVDDSEELLKAVARQLRAEPYVVLTATSAAKALSIAASTVIDVAVIDERMPHMLGSSLVDVLKKNYPQTINIMLTGHASLGLLHKLLNSRSIFRLLTKPYRADELRTAIRAALEEHTVTRLCSQVVTGLEHRSGELRKLERKFPGISHVERSANGALVLNEAGGEDIDSLIRVLELYTDEATEDAE